jgi:hypothetical protein
MARSRGLGDVYKRQALEDGAFLSSTDESSTTEDKARASRLAYIKKHYRVENLSLPSF